MLDTKKLREYFSYNESTGTVTREKTITYNAKKGDIVGCLDPSGYLKVGFCGKTYFLHRLIYQIKTGEKPNCIDHINQKRSDNRWINLRSVSYKTNNKNLPIRKDNTSGVVGVWWDNRRKKWWSHIANNGKRITLGYFESKEKAVKRRISAEIKYNYHENHGKIIGIHAD